MLCQSQRDVCTSIVTRASADGAGRALSKDSAFMVGSDAHQT